MQRQDHHVGQPYDVGLLHLKLAKLTLVSSCACLELEGLVGAYPRAHNAVVAITYLDGSVLEAIVVSHENDEIRAMAAACDDVLAFTRIHGIWISEEIEPVTIEFAWHHHGASPVTSEDAFVCPKKLAAYFIQTLFAGGEPMEDGLDPIRFKYR